MVYSLEAFAIVGLLSFAFGVLLGLLFLSEEKPSERARRIGLELQKIRAIPGSVFCAVFAGFAVLTTLPFYLFVLWMIVSAVLMLLCMSVFTAIPFFAILVMPMLAIFKRISSHEVPLAKKTWAPAEMRHARRKRQLRAQRDAKKHHRLRVRSEREVRAEHGAVDRLVIEAVQLRSVGACKIVCALRFIEAVCGRLCDCGLC